MTNYYIRSAAVGTGTGADWANAYTTLTTALTSKVAGDVFFISEDHTETAAAAKVFTSPGSITSPCYYYCVDHSGSVPPVAADLRTTAIIATTGTSSNISMTGIGYYYGIIFSAGSGGTDSSIKIPSSSFGSYNRFESCALQLAGTSVGLIDCGAPGNSVVELENTTVQFGATGQGIRINTVFFSWRNTISAITGATLPTALFQVASFSGGTVVVEGVDLSALGSGKTLVNATTSSTTAFMLKDCRLGASVVISAIPASQAQPRTDMIRCDSGAANYRTERYRFQGVETTETTIVRSGGASDGTTSIARKIVTTANSNWIAPFDAMPIVIWNDTTGSSVTVTVYGKWGGGAVPKNDEIWMDVCFLGSSGYPQGSFVTTTKANNLATGANLTSDSSVWGGSTTAFLMAASFTPQQKGPIYIYVKAAKPSSTFYIDPEVVLS